MPDSRGYPPETLRQYALLADGERGALVGPNGDIAFLCMPQWHSPAVFSSLVGGPGHYAVTPVDRYVWGGYYEEGSLIWRSRWVTSDGISECREALAFPGDRHRAVLLRRVEAREGTARVRVILSPRADFGRQPTVWTTSSPGLWEGRSGGLHLRWQSGIASCDCTDGAIETMVEVAPGQRHDLVLELSDEPLPATPPTSERTWAASAEAWRRELPSFPDTVAGVDVQHSYAVLRGLTSASNGMVAAATMGLPERADTGRNYDYRYAWIRDQCFVGQAAAAVGGSGLLTSATSFVSARILDDGPKLQPAYTVDGAPVPDESTLDLPGYPGGTATAGNHVNGQFQLDAFGESLLLFAAADLTGQHSEEQHRAACLAARAIEQRWREPDAGIWELDAKPWAHSRLICAAGLRRYAAARLGPDTRDWTALADQLVSATDQTALHPSGRWQRAPDDEGADASLLLPGLRGAVSPDDPRHRRTVEAVARDLSVDHYVFRFRHAPGPLNDSEGAFLVSGFHMAMATHQLGDAVDAVRWFERSRSAVGPPDLFTEEFDVVQRQLRGNLPQAFVHALLMEAATYLASPQEER